MPPVGALAAPGFAAAPPPAAAASTPAPLVLADALPPVAAAPLAFDLGLLAAWCFAAWLGLAFFAGREAEAGAGRLAAGRGAPGAADAAAGAAAATEGPAGWPAAAEAAAEAPGVSSSSSSSNGIPAASASARSRARSSALFCAASRSSACCFASASCCCLRDADRSSGGTFRIFASSRSRLSSRQRSHQLLFLAMICSRVSGCG